MICLSPITVANPTREYRPLTSKTFVQVPCCKCAACIQNNNNDWYVRLYYELEHYKKANGSCFFITLTYNEDEVPFIDTSSALYHVMHTYDNSLGELPYIKHRCFSKSHVQNFIKKLRIVLSRENYLPDTYEEYKWVNGQYTKFTHDSLKYFCVSEYGTNTHRPHYHILFFTPFIIDAGTFLKYVNRCWSREVKITDVPKNIQEISKLKGYTFQSLKEINNKRKELGIKPLKTIEFELQDWYIRFHSCRTKPVFLHKRGFCNYSEHGAQVFRAKACQYLLKYFHKDSEFMSLPAVQEIESYINSLPPLLSTDKKSAQYIAISNLKDFLPFHLVSKGFGSDLYEELRLKLKDNPDTLEKVISEGVALPQETNFYRVPTYIINKLFYESRYEAYDNKPYRYLTEIGKQALALKYETSIKTLSQSYHTYSSREIIQFLSVEQQNQFAVDFGNTVQASLSKLNEQFSHFDRTFIDLARYSLVYQNLPTYLYEETYPLSTFTYEDFRNLADCIIFEKINGHNERRANKFDPRVIMPSLHHLLDYKVFNSLEQFANFDYFLSIITWIQKAINQNKCNSKEEQDYKSRTIKSIFNSYIYV